MLAVPLFAAACVGTLGDDAPGRTTGAGPVGDDAAPSPLARLTSDQYTATLHDLFAPTRR